MNRDQRIAWVLSLTDDDLLTLAEALDSHAYWQLAEAHERNNGYVLTERVLDEDRRLEIEHLERMEQRIRLLLPVDRSTAQG